MNDASKNLRRALDLALAGPRNGLPHRDALSEKQKRSVLSDITDERFGEGTAASLGGRIADLNLALAGPRNGLPHRDALSEKQKRSVLSDITDERFGEGTAASLVGRI